MTYLADANMQMNRPQAARPLIEEAIRINPRMELPHLDSGILYADAGRKDDALREFKAAARLSPTDVNVTGGWLAFTRQWEGRTRQKPSSTKPKA